MMTTVAMEDVEGKFGRPEVMMASSNLMQKVTHLKILLWISSNQRNFAGSRLKLIV